MSNQRIVAARVKGYSEGPHFNDPIVRGRRRGLSRVQRRLAYHPERINGMLLDSVGEELPGKKVRMYLRTLDGYLALGGVEFAFEGKKVMVVFPMLHDSNKKDGTYADRHVALYTMGASDEGFRDRAAIFFAEKFVSVYRRMYLNAIKHSKEKNGIDQ